MPHPQLFEAIAYGDARGLSYETRTKEEISRLGGVASHLIAPDAHTDFEDFRDHPIGTWSDDTEHALLVAESLSGVGGYELTDIASRLKAALPFAQGWGKTTRTAIGRIHDGMTAEQLTVNGEQKGHGCGPLMRSAPLAVFAWRHYGLEEQRRIALENAGLTHNSPQNKAATLVHHRLLHLLCETPDVSSDLFLRYAIDWSVVAERQLQSEPKLSEVLKRIYRSPEYATELYDPSKRWSAFTTWAVQATAYSYFIRHLHDELDVLLTAVIAEGGDTDSTASLATTLWALANPERELPSEINLLQDLTRLQSASRCLIELVA